MSEQHSPFNPRRSSSQLPKIGTNPQIRTNPNISARSVPYPSESLQAPKIQNDNSLRARITHNLSLKIIALVISLVLFVLVFSDKNATITFNHIPVVVSLPDGYALKHGKIHSTTAVTLNGPISQLKTLRDEDLGIIVLLPSARPGELHLRLTKDKLSLPKGVEISAFRPAFVDIELEQIATKMLPINLKHATIGELPAGYQLGELSASPAQVEFKGPRTTLLKLNSALINPVDISEKTESFSIDRDIVSRHEGVQPMHRQKVKLHVQIIEHQQSRRITNIPIIPMNVEGPFRLLPDKIDLVFTGQPKALKNLDPNKIFITVDGSIINNPDTDEQPKTKIIKISLTNVQNLPPEVAIDPRSRAMTILEFLPTTNDTTQEANTMNHNENAAIIDDNNTTNSPSPDDHTDTTTEAKIDSNTEPDNDTEPVDTDSIDD